MSRIVRERGSVGRRIWRRRLRRRGGPSEAEPTASQDDGFLSLPTDPLRDVHSSPEAPSRGFLSSLREKLFGKTEAATDPESLTSNDPVADVLAVPRGAARLDAFEVALTKATVGQSLHRELALAFLRELSALASNAELDLSLLGSRVEACAQALLAAGEEEKAGALFLKVGARHRAAETFLQAGAIEELEEAYAHMRWDDGGAKHDARLAFERFEALYVVGMRDAALASLERALRLWGDNPVFVEVHRSFLERVGPPHRRLLKAGRLELMVSAKWPLVVGRGENAGVRLMSPLLSREHVQLVQLDGRVWLRDLDSRGGTGVDGVALEAPVALKEAGHIDMGGVVVRYVNNGQALALIPTLTPDRQTWVPLGPVITLPHPTAGSNGSPSTDALRFDANGRAVALQGSTLNGEKLSRDTLVLIGDRLGTFTVSHPASDS
jgi:tetratricopeptide (TPR) repeat protein